MNTPTHTLHHLTQRAMAAAGYRGFVDRQLIAEMYRQRNGGRQIFTDEELASIQSHINADHTIPGDQGIRELDEMLRAAIERTIAIFVTGG